MGETGGTSKHSSRVAAVGCLVFAVPLLLVFSPIIAAFLAWEEVRSRGLYRQFRRRHGPTVRGLLIYSNSPNWQAYIEQEWIPRLEGRLVVLNWSERARWREDFPLESRIFRQLGDREFNPAAIIFRPPTPGRRFRRWLRAIRELDALKMLAPYESSSDIVRFFQPFRDYKHGRDHTLRAAERTLWTLLGDSDSPETVA